MNKLYYLCICILLCAGCDYEDERANDFAIDYNIFGGNKVDGTITNLSSTPANNISIKVYISYENGETDFDYIEVNQQLYQNESAEFCHSEDDEIDYVDLTITNVD